MVEIGPLWELQYPLWDIKLHILWSKILVLSPTNTYHLLLAHRWTWCIDWCFKCHYCSSALLWMCELHALPVVWSGGSHCSKCSMYQLTTVMTDGWPRGCSSVLLKLACSNLAAKTLHELLSDVWLLCKKCSDIQRYQTVSLICRLHSEWSWTSGQNSNYW